MRFRHENRPADGPENAVFGALFTGPNWGTTGLLRVDGTVSREGAVNVTVICGCRPLPTHGWFQNRNDLGFGLADRRRARFPDLRPLARAASDRPLPGPPRASTKARSRDLPPTGLGPREGGGKGASAGKSPVRARPLSKLIDRRRPSCSQAGAAGTISPCKQCPSRSPAGGCYKMVIVSAVRGGDLRRVPRSGGWNSHDFGQIATGLSSCPGPAH